MRSVDGYLIVLVFALCAGACSLKGDLTPLGSFIVDDIDDSTCVLSRLSDQSRYLDFRTGTGKLYSVSFQIQSGGQECSTDDGEIDVRWHDLEIDEIPDFGKSKISLTGGASVIGENGQALCSTGDLIIAYSDWYEVRPLALNEFRPPVDAHDPRAASKVAFERFLRKFADFFVQECR